MSINRIYFGKQLLFPYLEGPIEPKPVNDEELQEEADE